MKPKLYNQVYGKYSSGSGTIMKNKENQMNYFKKNYIKLYQNEIKKNLKRMKVDFNKIKFFKIMNIGTGRESIAFLKFKPDSICHYDISQLNVSRFKKFLKKKKITKIISKQCDIVNYKLPPNKFDIVYTHGVVQHFSNPEKGIYNCLKSLKIGGIIWLYFYRSGTLQHFINSMIRDLSINFQTNHFYKYLLQSQKFKNVNYFISAIMDSLFVDYYHLYHPKNFLKFVKFYGLKLINHSKLFPYDRNINHNLHPSTILICKKLKKISKNKNLTLLSSKNSINQLNIKLYLSKKDFYIKKTLIEYLKFKEIFKKHTIVERYKAVIKLFKINIQSYNHYVRYGNYRSKFYHKKLIKVFQEFIY